MSFNINVNGKKHETQSALSICEFLEQKNIKPSTVIVEYNYDIPDREKWKEIMLKDGDNLEIIKFMGGG